MREAFASILQKDISDIIFFGREKYFSNLKFEFKNNWTWNQVFCSYKENLCLWT